MKKNQYLLGAKAFLCVFCLMNTEVNCTEVAKGRARKALAAPRVDQKKQDPREVQDPPRGPSPAPKPLAVPAPKPPAAPAPQVNVQTDLPSRESTNFILSQLASKRLGSGAYGDVTVVKGLDSAGRTIVAAQKTQKNPKSNDLKIEAEFLAAISEKRAPRCFPRVLTFSSGTEGIKLFSEYFDGPTLDRRIESKILCGTYLLPKEIVVNSYALLVALRFLHQEGIIHRDLKGNNVLFNYCGYPTIIDFGLSKKSGTESRKFNSRYSWYPPWTVQKFGVPHEYFKQTPIIDLYGLGVLMLTMFTTRRSPNIKDISECRDFCKSIAAHPSLKILFEAAETYVKAGPNDEVKSADQVVREVEAAIPTSPPENSSALASALEQYHRWFGCFDIFPSKKPEIYMVGNGRDRKLKPEIYTLFCEVWKEIESSLRQYQRYKYSDSIASLNDHFLAANDNRDDFSVQAQFFGDELVILDRIFEDVTDCLSKFSLTTGSSNFVKFLNSLRSYCIQGTGDLNQLKRLRIGKNALSPQMLMNPHYTLACFCDYAITQGSRGITSNSSFNDIVVDALTKCSKVASIRSINSVALYSRLSAYALKFMTVDLSVHKTIHPLFMEVARWIYDQERGPHIAQIATACDVVQLGGPEPPQIIAYIPARITEIMNSRPWTYEQIGNLENLLRSFLSLQGDALNAWLRTHGRIGDVPLSKTMLANPCYTWMCVCHWLIEHGKNISEASVLMNRLVSKSIVHYLTNFRRFTGEIPGFSQRLLNSFVVFAAQTGAPIEVRSPSALKQIWDANQPSSSNSPKFQYAFSGDYREISDKDLAVTEATPLEYIYKDVEALLDKISPWTDWHREKFQEALTHLENFCTGVTTNVAPLRSIKIGNSSLSEDMITHPHHVWMSLCDWGIMHPKASMRPETRFNSDFLLNAILKGTVSTANIPEEVNSRDATSMYLRLFSFILIHQPPPLRMLDEVHKNVRIIDISARYIRGHYNRSVTKYRQMADEVKKVLDLYDMSPRSDQAQ